MKSEEVPISFASVKRYLSLLKSDINQLNYIEFGTLKSWLVYSLALVVTLTVPCMLILLLTGILSGNIAFDLLIAVSLIPFMFILPMVLLFTFICNYRRPKRLRRKMLHVVNRYEWDVPPQKIAQLQFESRKDGYTFRTEARRWKKQKGREEWLISMIVPYFMPVEKEKEEDYIADIEAYLEGKSLFVIQRDMAYFAVPLKIFSRLAIAGSIDQLLYVMQRFRLHPCTTYSPVAIINKVPVTHEILAMTIFGQEIDGRWTRWAQQMIGTGFVNETLFQFVKQIPDSGNQKELREQMKLMIREFNLDISSEDVFTNYIRYLLMEEENGKKSLLDALRCLARLSRTSGLSELHTFELLYQAKKALLESGTQDIWTEAALSPENADNYIREYLYAWGKDH